jgi:coatomer protein complex subunit epsilon
MADRDILFGVKNNFYIGAYNNAINEASDLGGLSDAEQTEKDVFVYRSYIAIGSHDVSASNALLALASRKQLPAVRQHCCCCCWLVLSSLQALQQNRNV